VPTRGVDPEGEERLDPGDIRGPLPGSGWFFENTDYFPG